MDVALRNVLEPAYRCVHFDGVCKGQAVWNPTAGHFPRGYFGALGNLDEVKLVMVFAEPAPPSVLQSCLPESANVDTAFQFARESYMEYTGRGGKGHAIVRDILTSAFPGLTLLEIMRRVWITETVLCSARTALAPVESRCEQTCMSTYLVQQLSLFPKAIIAAMGTTKAYSRLKRYSPEYLDRVVSCHNPFGYRGGYSETWTTLVRRVRQHT